MATSSRHAERTYTTEQAAAELGVPAGVISVWRHRRRIAPAGIIPGPSRTGMVPLYRLEELAPLAAAYHSRTSSATRSDATAV